MQAVAVPRGPPLLAGSISSQPPLRPTREAFFLKNFPFVLSKNIVLWDMFSVSTARNCFFFLLSAAAAFEQTNCMRRGLPTSNSFWL